MGRNLNGYSDLSKVFARIYKKFTRLQFAFTIAIAYRHP